MAYADQKQNKTIAMGSAALVQLGLGAALLTGFVVTTAPRPKAPPTVVKLIPLDKPIETPPPPEPVKEVVERVDTPVPPLHIPEAVVPRPDTVDLVGTTVITPPPPPVPPIRIEIAPPPTPPVAPPVNLSRGLQPRGDQGYWFPRDSYPAAARRAGAEGRVSVTVDVGVTGRVTGCRVAVSSGNEDLDQTTCRLATRNGRFTPALNAAGEPVPGTLTLRPVRWTLEE
ncbi:TonB family protein [Sphingomonas lenta]|uniref:Energy transducer TonB n=1 Tax=Sphingomonas lenta TaxID=1141887 RepID=A0A2A2SKG3_9SPHN|nr:TonB family protein [Sphingomonas lenta]PAX09708.1 energy transducer TonB [Sphingomonas lenta]